MQTQWRVGMSGATGLDYGPLFTRMSRLSVEWEQTFDDIRVLEAAALEQMRKDRG